MNVSAYGVGSRSRRQAAGTSCSPSAGDLDFHNGQVYGGDAAAHGGYCNDLELRYAQRAALTCPARPTCTIAAADCGEMCDIAGASWPSKDNTNCDITVHPWGAVEIDADGDAVCDLDLDRVAAGFADYVWKGLINGMTVKGDRGSTVVINVTSDNGNDIWGKNGSFNLHGVEASDVIWNFGCDSFCPSDAHSPLAGVGIKGTLLAPSCHTYFNNGHIDGQYIVKSHSGNGEFHDFGFDGDICIDDGAGSNGSDK